MSNILRRNFNKLTAASASTVAALGMSACSSTIDYGPIDKKVKCIELSDGAKIRNEARVINGNSGDNVVLEVDLVDNDRYKVANSFEVDTLSGAYRSLDSNGDWFGIKADDLVNSFKSEKDIKKIRSDKDGILWINEARASDCTEK